MGKIIGIDLGTTNGAVAVMVGSKPTVLANEEGAFTTPSVVAWTEKGQILVGQAAKRQAATNVESTILGAKRFLGRKLEEVARETKRLPYPVGSGANGESAFSIRGKTLSPQEVCAQILLKLRKSAEAFLGEKVSEAVIAVPAHFDDAQRGAIRDAGGMAGLDVRRILSESTAAALAFGLDRKRDEVIAIYDFGGGCFDISIVEAGPALARVIATDGDGHLGGDDIDDILIDWLSGECRKTNGIDVTKDKVALQRLREAAEKAKVELSSAQDTSVNLPSLTVGWGGPVHLDVRLSRARLDQMIAPLVGRMTALVQRALAESKKSVTEIDEVVLVGGSTRIPLVRESARRLFGKAASPGVNGDEAVAVGAAIQAGILSGDVKGVVVLDRAYSVAAKDAVTSEALAPPGAEPVGEARREQIERRSQLDDLCHAVATSLGANAPPSTPELFALEGSLREGRKAVEQRDDGLIRAALERLTKEARHMASPSPGGVPAAATVAPDAVAGADQRHP